MTVTNFWLSFFLFGAAGLGLGIGLVLGTFVTRTLRRLMKEDDEPKQT